MSVSEAPPAPRTRFDPAIPAPGIAFENQSSLVLPGIDLAALQECALLPSINQAVREFRKRFPPPAGR